MGEELLPRRCGLFTPGHEVHWIQGLRAGNDVESPRVQGRLVSAEADGLIRIDLKGEVRTFWNHEPDRLEMVAARNANRVEVQWRWRVLRVPSNSGAYLFYLAESDERRDSDLRQ
jgi:hypothetical protein